MVWGFKRYNGEFYMDYKEFLNRDKKNYFGFIIVILIIIFCLAIFSFFNKKDVSNNKEKRIFSVTIESNGSIISNSNLSCYTYGDKCRVNLPVIKRDGYDIVGYSLNGDVLYSSGESIELDSDIVLYVVTKRDVVLSLVDVLNNETKTLGCTLYNNDISCEVTLPSSDGSNSFQGWSDEIGGLEANYSFNQSIYLTQDKRIYYVRSKEVSVFLFDGDKSSRISCLIKGNQDSCEVTLPSSSKDGFESVGWSSEKNSSLVKYNNLSVISISSDINLYAVFKKSFVIKFDSNGSSVRVSDIKCDLYNQSTCNFSFPSITRDGYEIIGWSENKDATSGYKVGSKLSVNDNKTYYAITRKIVRASFASNNYATVNDENRSCYIYNTGTSCLVNTPSVRAISGSFAGWSKVNGSYSIDYSDSNILINKDIVLYPVTKKVIVVNFNANGASYIDYNSKTCELYNGNTSCDIVIPNVDKPGMISYGFNESLSNTDFKPKYISNETYSFSDSITLYADFSTSTFRYRNISVYSQKKYNNITLEVESVCNYDEIERKVNKLFNDWPSIFKYNLKVTYLSESSFKRIHSEDDAIGITYGPDAKYGNPKLFVDLICDTTGDIFVHEMMHYHDFMYELKYRSKLSDSSELSSLYNKYKYSSDRPLRDYSYVNREEFMAEIAMFYYSKYYLGENVYLPLDIENFVIQNLMKTVE